ncbi:hypothetical protein [Streptomyces sp. CNQ085]|uniref:hypothetical protein n=1 Tax=Streptomyces sp. CNQ085 TaxID=2886944 RepID=UPI001F50D5ED|nr:hypothetical protein [Streptomyces sp. CNQ085]MCI0385798.1 hypothetical protein [Streptomyces sp. CNQ085]
MSLPVGLFGFGPVVVLVHWLTVLVGAAGVDALDGGESIDADHSGTGPTTLLAAAGLGGAPVSVSLSLLIVIAWFASLSGTVPAERAGGEPRLVFEPLAEPASVDPAAPAARVGTQRHMTIAESGAKAGTGTGRRS